jgi:hypothetical protein
VTEAWPELWVLDATKADEARRLVEDALGEGDPAGDDWLCPRCWETVEGQFGPFCDARTRTAWRAIQQGRAQATADSPLSGRSERHDILSFVASGKDPRGDSGLPARGSSHPHRPSKDARGRGGVDMRRDHAEMKRDRAPAPCGLRHYSGGRPASSPHDRGERRRRASACHPGRHSCGRRPPTSGHRSLRPPQQISQLRAGLCADPPQPHTCVCRVRKAALETPLIGTLPLNPPRPGLARGR